MIGKRFGMLTVTGRAAWPAGKPSRGALYRCSCDCGGARTALASYLRAGRVRSCGCRNRAGGRCLSAEQRARAVELARQGVAINAIARSIGVAWNTAKAVSRRGAKAA